MTATPLINEILQMLRAADDVIEDPAEGRALGVEVVAFLLSRVPVQERAGVGAALVGRAIRKLAA